ncbi:MAG: RidA family protein [Dysgonamonadaceae bacterium]|jgi:2-iminobutanoate/2-iminopropanoate deaminase|nr:RidA family protein [Dysgonamonadaceae bacterium]
MKHCISTPKAPAAIGPYSQAVQAGNLLFLSGQLGIDPATGDFVPGQVTEQTEQIFKNIQALLNEAHLTLDQVVKTTVFLADMTDFAAMNAVYGRYFTPPYPARSAVAVKTLPKNGRVEIEVIAAV